MSAHLPRPQGSAVWRRSSRAGHPCDTPLEEKEDTQPVSATGEEQKGAQSLEEMLVGPGWFLGVALSHLPLLCAFPHPPPRSDSHTLLVSVIPPTTGPLHMLFTFFFFDQQVVIKHLLCPKHRQFSGKQGRPLTSRGLPD